MKIKWKLSFLTPERGDEESSESWCSEPGGFGSPCEDEAHVFDSLDEAFAEAKALQGNLEEHKGPKDMREIICLHPIEA